MRFRKDIPGQEKRQNARLRICPIEGEGALGAPARQRRAAELIAPYNTEAHFVAATTPPAPAGVTFADQVPIWLEQIQRNTRKPVRAWSVDHSYRPTLNKHILPRIGALPLSECAKYSTMRKLVADLVEAKLAPQTVTQYFGHAAGVVASFENENCDPVYPIKWNFEKPRMPVVKN